MFAITVIVIGVGLFFRYLYRRSAPSLSNVRGPPRESFIFGNILKLISESAEGYDFHADLGRNYGGVVKIHSILGTKDLYVFDHAAMESILVKQEPIFNMPDSLLAANHLIFGTCLVSTSGAQHRRGRKIMNPAFAPARLKALLPIIHEIAHQTADAIASTIDGQRVDMDLSPFLGSTTLEFIGQAGLGHSFGAAGSVDTLHGMKELLQAAKRLIVPMQALPLMMKILSPELRRYLIDYIPSSDLHTCKTLVDILDNTTKEILSRKKQALEAGDTLVDQLPGHGKDIISLLLKASASAKSADDQLSEKELLGQMSVILFAGTDTTTTAMARCLNELSLDMDIQDRLRRELTAASPHGDLTFEQLNTLPLLEAVCRETLRMYPPAVTASRQALADAIIPIGKPMSGEDGKTITELFVPKGTLVHIGIKAANQDKSVWGADATEWKPDRWFSLPKTVTEAKIPGIYPKLMSFIGGPRGCIGFGFAEMTMKAFLAILVKNFVFYPSKKEIVWKLGVAEAPTCEGEQAFPIVIAPVSA